MNNWWAICLFCMKLWCINGKWILEGANLAKLFYSSWNNNIFKILYCVSAREKCTAIREHQGSYLWEKSTNWKLIHMTALILYYYLVKRSYNNLCSVTNCRWIYILSMLWCNDYVCRSIWKIEYLLLWHIKNETMVQSI